MPAPRAGADDDRPLGLDREPFPATFERWRVVLPPESERATGAAEWAGAVVLVERGRIEICCVPGGQATFAAGDVIALDWLPLRKIRNPGPGAARLLAVRRRRPPPGGRSGATGRPRALADDPG